VGWLKEDIESALYHDRFLLASKFHELVPLLSSHFSTGAFG